MVGDFNNYGGIYRPVQPDCYQTHYVLLALGLRFSGHLSPPTESGFQRLQAQVEVLTKVSNGRGQKKPRLTYETAMLDASGEVVDNQSTAQTVSVGESEVSHTYTLSNPHLWHGKKDPYQYQVRVELKQNGRVIDTQTEPLGLRYFRIDANEGFFLNDEPMDLRGVSRHQDRQDKASALSDADHRQDMDFMLEMGINALRLAHYQHAEKMYDMADSAGIIVWAELPWVGAPGGFLSNSNGYESTEAFHANAQQQLYELIRQNYNHPSIVMWSIFNEIQNPEGAEPTEFINTLNAIVKTEDPSRLSVGASMLNPDKHANVHDITDVIAWNRYFGWYYKEPKDMAAFLDETHTNFPEYKIGISEYGAGGSIFQHTDKLARPNPLGSPHPEEWQSYYHEENLKIFDERPYVWGTFIWNMFDFGSHFRKEGDHFGINDKGMVTYDRKTRKDVFFFYKANWSEEPVLHITSSRYVFRKKKNTQVKVYTNLNEVSLTVNGKNYPSQSPQKGIIIWENVSLEKGNNGIIVQASQNGQTYTDDCVWVIEDSYSGVNLFINIFDFLSVGHLYAIGGLVLAFLMWFVGLRKRPKRARWKRIGLRIGMIVLILVSLIILLMKYYVSNMMGG